MAEGAGSTPRLFVDHAPGVVWRPGGAIDLTASAVRHAQVLRLQPGHGVTLFDGQAGQWEARILEMGRQSVRAELLAHDPVERELGLRVTLAVCMPANDRMDDLVEKATELGAAAIVPLMSERSVLRLSGERSLKKQAHWQAVAAAACEQCGRNRVTRIDPVQPLSAWLDPSGGALHHTAHDQNHTGLLRWQLSLHPQAQALALAIRAAAPPPVGNARTAPVSICVLSGPEGGLTEAEQALALNRQWVPVGLGPRILRADTAPLAALAALGTLAALATACNPASAGSAA